MVPCMFVYADGKVGLRELPASLASALSYREPVQQPFRFSLEREENLDLSKPTYAYREWTRRGKTFDGRPVFCAEGYDLKLVGAQAMFTHPEEQDVIDTELTNQVLWFLAENLPNAIHLDTRREDITVDSLFKGQAIRQRSLRLLVAYHV